MYANLGAQVTLEVNLRDALIIHNGIMTQYQSLVAMPDSPILSQAAHALLVLADSIESIINAEKSRQARAASVGGF